MQMNNFNVSSTGASIELTLMRDDDLAMIMLEEDWRSVESKKVREIFGVHRRDNLYVSAATLENLGCSEVDIETVYGTQSAEQLKIITDNIDWQAESAPDCGSLEELYDEYCSSLDVRRFEKESGLSPKVKVVMIHGYYQGDVVYVLMEESAEYSHGNLQNVFFNQPIYAQMTVTVENAICGIVEHEFNIHEQLEDVYDYDKETVKSKAMELVAELTEAQREEVLRFLTNSLPESI